MRKELLFAIFTGGFLGLVIAFGIWRANSAFKNARPSSTSLSPTNQSPIPSAIPNSQSSLTIAQPDNETVSDKDTIKITGITKPGSYLAIVAEGNDYILESSDTGAFESDISLIPGLNEIKVFAFDNEGRTSSSTLNIVYSTELDGSSQSQ